MDVIFMDVIFVDVIFMDVIFMDEMEDENTLKYLVKC